MSTSLPAQLSPKKTAGPTSVGSTIAGAKIERLLVVRLGAMGDVMHGLPAVTALRAAFPEAMLGWLIEERWAEMLCTLPTPRSGPRSAQRPLVDRVHTVNTRQWRRAPFSAATWERVAASLSDLRAARYEAAVDFQGAVRSSLLARCLRRQRVRRRKVRPRANIASPDLRAPGTHARYAREVWHHRAFGSSRDHVRRSLSAATSFLESTPAPCPARRASRRDRSSQ